MYKRKIYKLGDVIEVEDYHTSSFKVKKNRVEKQEATPERIEKANQRNREKRCRRQLRKHFRENDYFVTLTYKEDERPECMKDAKQDFQRFVRKLKREYAKKGEELKWIRNIEVGSRGAWHVHIVVNRIADADLMITKAWQHGKIIIKPMYEQGDFRELAAYMVKTPKTDKRLKEVSHSTSRNLPVPEPEVRKYKFRNHWNKPYALRGWELDKGSVYEGINIEGYPVREYTLKRIKNGKGKLSGDKRERVQNADHKRRDR